MKFLFVLLLTATGVIAKAQQITGWVKDEGGTPLSNATARLVKKSDSSLVKLAVTGADGSYKFSGIKEGEYRVSVSFVGYKPAFSTVFSYSATDIVAPELKLAKVATDLRNVTVTATRPLVEVRADKTVMNVEGTINSVGSNALELLRKSPGVLIDKDDNLSMAGKNGVQVYIDNKPTPLSGADLANYLKNIPSSQIDAIELITNPSARYDAAGNAGIINIRFKKNQSLGANGSVNAGWNISKTAKYNGGASLNYRNDKLNIFTTYSFNHSPNIQNITLDRNILDSSFYQNNRILDLRRAHNFKIGADFFLDKKNTIGVLVNAMISGPSADANGKTIISNKGITDRLLVASNDNDMKRNNVNLNLNYNYIDPKGTSFSVNADKGAFQLNSDQYQQNHYYDPVNQNLLSSVIYHIVSPAEININSIKADYEQNFLKGKLAIGAKSAWVKTDNSFQRFNVFSSGEDFDEDRSNDFVYTENINAGYISFNRKFKTFQVQVGLRAENTVSQGDSRGLKFNGTGYEPNMSTFRRSYTDLFPSASITFNKDPMKQWSLSYSRRIDRPAYQDLNPFEFRLDEYTYMKGNINLRPQYTNSFGITHIYKFKLNVALNYSHVKDMFTQIIDTTEKSKAFISKKNLATQDVVNLSVSYPFTYKAYTLFTNISANYSVFKANFGTGRTIDLNAVGFNVFVQNSLKFAKVWTAELSGFFNAPTIYSGSFKGKSIHAVDMGLSKLVMKGKGTLKAAVSDAFNILNFRAETDFAGQAMNFRYKQESRQLKLSFSYRFGNSKVKAARQRTTGAEDESKRVQQGGGMGIGN